MKPNGAIELQEELSESVQSALLKLLADEDPAVWQAVRDKIISYGPATVEWLRPHALSREPALRRRAQEIILHFGRRAADERFLGFCLKHGTDFDLEEGTWLLAQTQFPEINIEAYAAVLDQFAGDLKERLAPEAGGRALLAQVNQYLFVELGFTGNEEAYYDPDNSYLNRVIDRRTGNPISLCLLYMYIARRLRMPVAGIGLPGHFICRYQSTSEEIFFDPFNRGAFLSKAECLQQLARGNRRMRDHFLAPVNARQILLRVCANLHQIYQQLDWPNETIRLQGYLVALRR